jgi:hypothetical protein
LISVFFRSVKSVRCNTRLQQCPAGRTSFANRLVVYAGARALAQWRRDEQSTSNLIEFSRIEATFGQVA